MKKWDGKTQGSLLGYRFFVFCIEKLGLRFSYFFCFFVSIFYTFSLAKARRGVMSFHIKSFNVGRARAFFMAQQTFFNYSRTLVDKIAISMSRKKQYSFDSKNGAFIQEKLNDGRGCLLISGHIGNGEIAGNIISGKTTSEISVVVVDNEIKQIKEFLKSKTGDSGFKLIQIKDDFSHLIQIKQAASRNELIALHGDRLLSEANFVEVEMFGNKARFPLGPFKMATKFKIPVVFVFALKTGYRHYSLDATKPSREDLGAESLLGEFVSVFKSRVEAHPTQWYNFFDFYVS
jgi:predicted LPLAT superfamily acyltransferase